MSVINKVAIAYSKWHDEIGLVALSVEEKTIQVRAAKTWTKKQINLVPTDVINFCNRFNLNTLGVDLEIGHDIIDKLKQNITIHKMHLGKNTKDFDEDEDVLDKIEVTDWLISLRQNLQFLFPKNPSSGVQELERQLEIYAITRSESGRLDMFAPSDEKDSLVRALLIAAKSCKPHITNIEENVTVGGAIDFHKEDLIQ